jgi:hypothetical protein
MKITQLNSNLNLEIQQEKIISINDVLIPSLNMAINFNQSEDEVIQSASSLSVNGSSYYIYIHPFLSNL